MTYNVFGGTYLSMLYCHRWRHGIAMNIDVIWLAFCLLCY